MGEGPENTGLDLQLLALKVAHEAASGAWSTSQPTAHEKIGASVLQAPNPADNPHEQQTGSLPTFQQGMQPRGWTFEPLQDSAGAQAASHEEGVHSASPVSSFHSLHSASGSGTPLGLP